MPNSRKRGRRRPPSGSTPGTLAVDPSLPPPQMRLLAYGPEGIVDKPLTSAEELREYLAGTWPVVWLDVDGLGDATAIEAVGAVVGLHRLSLADVVNLQQRPKVEDYGSYIFAVARMPTCINGVEVDTEQVSIVLGPRFVLTFQEQLKEGDCFGGVRERIRTSSGKIRSRGPDYLAYALIDATVDAYFPVLEQIGETLDSMEDEVLRTVNADAMQKLHHLRRQLVTIRRATWPLREAVAVLHREHFPLITDETRLYIRDCYDHAVQIIDLVETYRELGAGLMEVYLSMVSYRLNEVMKLLTIISTIFIPLTFIAGVYGMNFHTDVSRWNMPELTWPFGYPLVMTLMLAIALAMLWFFWQKGWLGKGPRPR